jgi:glycosyltransferase involved in cell wall biosynthesis
MINDVCWMAEALSKHLPYEVKRVVRSRDPFSKTIGLAAKIAAAEADLYHVFYLLQDAYLALKMGKKPAVGHACGSDIRDALHSKWGWMVRHNLKNLSYILSSQPTIVPQIREFTDKVEYFPIPIDPELFRPAPFHESATEPRLLYTSPVNFRVKGTDKVLQAVSQMASPVKFMAIKYGEDLPRVHELSRKLNAKVEWINRQPHDRMANLYWTADLILGNFGVGQLDTTVVEAMACGRPVVHHLAPSFFPEVPLRSYGTVEEFADDIEAFLLDRERAEHQVQRQLDYVKVHHADRAAKRLVEVYEQVG